MTEGDRYNLTAFVRRLIYVFSVHDLRRVYAGGFLLDPPRRCAALIPKQARLPRTFSTVTVTSFPMTTDSPGRLTRIRGSVGL